LIVHSPKIAIVANGKHQTSVGFTLGETIHFGSLVFIADHFGNLSLSPEGNDSCAIFMGIVHNRLPSLHTILKESVDEDDMSSSRGASSIFPIS
jgi:hypothetical protein